MPGRVIEDQCKKKKKRLVKSEDLERSWVAPVVVDVNFVDINTSSSAEPEARPGVPVPGPRHCRQPGKVSERIRISSI